MFTNFNYCTTAMIVRHRLKFGTYMQVLVCLAWSVLSSPIHAAQAISGPDVVIIAGQDKVVYEFRQNGILRMVRVVPNWGKPYYLVPRDNTKGYGNLERADMLLPQWIIAEF